MKADNTATAYEHRNHMSQHQDRSQSPNHPGNPQCARRTQPTETGQSRFSSTIRNSILLPSQGHNTTTRQELDSIGMLTTENHHSDIEPRKVITGTSIQGVTSADKLTMQVRHSIVNSPTQTATKPSRPTSTATYLDPSHPPDPSCSNRCLSIQDEHNAGEHPPLTLSSCRVKRERLLDERKHEPFRQGPLYAQCGKFINRSDA